MEKIMSPEERIRRAEEIYYKRQSQGVRVSTTSVNVGAKNKVSLGKKMIIQIIVCVLIYSFFYIIKDKENYFSKATIETATNMLSYDINFGNLYNQCANYVNGVYNNLVESSKKIGNSNNQNENGEENVENSEEKLNQNQVVVNTENSELIENKPSKQNTEESLNGNEVNVQSNNIEENIGDTQNVDEQNTDAEKQQETIEEQSKTQMQLDAEYIKTNCNLIVPVQGYITSGFGDREETEIISAFHQGVDIGAVTGTPIYAAMEGTVVASSYAGDYGNHIKIQNGDILTVYAHCSELEVSVGEYIYQNQEIAKVGATR